MKLYNNNIPTLYLKKKYQLNDTFIKVTYYISSCGLFMGAYIAVWRRGREWERKGTRPPMYRCRVRLPVTQLHTNCLAFMAIKLIVSWTAYFQFILALWYFCKWTVNLWQNWIWKIKSGIIKDETFRSYMYLNSICIAKQQQIQVSFIPCVLFQW